jgi:hypothetical protein
MEKLFFSSVLGCLLATAGFPRKVVVRMGKKRARALVHGLVES